MLTTEQIRSARMAGLYEFLRRNHPDEVKQEGRWVRWKANPSICTKQGLGGYKDYATLESGNSIDFLVRHLGYDFVTAVTRLTATNAMAGIHGQSVKTHDLILPDKSEDDRLVRAYLSGRGFTGQVIDQLIEKGLLYQDICRNAVFCSAEGDFFELRGTRPDHVFHQCGKKFPDRCWCFIPANEPEQAFVCESAIDAVSLYLLHLKSGETGGNAYCGIAGVANQQAIDRIRCRFSVVIAVDNDAAGQQCRWRNRDLPSVVPQAKDWNEDLMMTMKRC